MNQILQSYADAYRDLVNDKNLGTNGTIKSALRLNKDEDWSFIATSMDIVGDASFAVDNFLEFGLDGPTRYKDEGEKYLRLYGILSATYIQQQAIFTLFKLNNLPHPKKANENIQALKIREVRNKIASHSCDYKNATQNGRMESYVPIRITLSGFNCGYINNETLEIENIDLKDCLNKHIELMIDYLDTIIEKSIKTFFRGNKKKMDEYNKKLKELRILRSGGTIIKMADGEGMIVILGRRPD